MKLIHCYIENFGKLKNQDISFMEGCQCFYHENGWGKSTLTAFIKVMFYGFEHERSRDDYVNERKRYRPWQGGVYGGTLTFEKGGKRYTIERTFGLREKEDQFMLRDEETNLESQDYSSNLGEEIFHLDRMSFEKTILFSQNDCGTKATDRIQAKLGNLTDATDDVNQYEKADSRLNDILNAMSPDRKTGSLYRLQEQIGDLEAELRRSENLEREIESLQDQKKELKRNYSKYKEIQEILLRQQKEITIQKDYTLERIPDSLPKKENGAGVLSRWYSIIGVIIAVIGVILFHSHKEGAVFCLILGGVFLLIDLWKQKKKRVRIQSELRQQQIGLVEDRTNRIEEVQQRLRKIQIMIEKSYQKIIQLEQETQDKEKKRDRYAEKDEQLVVLKEQFHKDFAKYERLKLTKACLAEAKAAYASRYRSPLMQAFSNYYEMISGEKADFYRMDTNMELSVQEYGYQREARYFSAGWKDLMGICMRMALLDTMYQGEKPFLILDDPFVNLDQNKTKAALTFLKQIGEDYQIIYFTCHESRAI